MSRFHNSLQFPLLELYSSIVPYNDELVLQYIVLYPTGNPQKFKEIWHNHFSKYEEVYDKPRMNNIDNTKTWTPCEDILDNFRNISYAIVILNCPINLNVDHSHVLDLWTHAKLRVTVNGGTKRWLNWLQAHQSADSDIFFPDLITGDMDSLSPRVLEYFREKHSKVIRTPDQGESDFTKALRVIQTHCDSQGIEIDSIFVLGDTSGRFDQILANINTIFKAAEFMPNVKIFQIATNSVTWLLKSGRHRISIPENLREKQEWCALIPIGAPCLVSSSGLKWNLDKTQLAFGGMVSTSNTYSGEPFVIITTNGFVVWSMGIEAIL